jgi:hypothetical protein
LSGGIAIEECGSHPPISESQPAGALKCPAVYDYLQDTKRVVSSLPMFEKRINNCVLVCEVMVLLDSELEGYDNFLKNGSSRIHLNGMLKKM